MSLQDILTYPLIETEKFRLTLYGILAVSVTLMAGFLLQKLLKSLFNRLVLRKKIDYGSSLSLFQITKYLLWILILITTLESIGVKVSILIASAAALLVGVGLGLQQLFNDFASGIILLVEQNLKIDDIIELDDGTVGKVTAIGIRTSKIITRDDILMIVPNSKFVNENIVNWSHVEELTRFSVDVGVAYGSDVKLVEKLLLKSVEQNSAVALHPTPFVRFEDFGESSLDFRLFFWVKDTIQAENVKSDLRFAIDELFRTNAIQIPFPQRDVHIKTKD